MKAVLAAIGGFMAASFLLVCGAAFAVHLIARPADGEGPGPGSAMAGAGDAGPLERIAARPPTESQLALARSAIPNRSDGQDPDDGVDTTETTSIGPAGGAAGGNEGIADDGMADPAHAQMLAAHLDWCAQRYRSYRPRDNSYTPYGGGRSICVSPFSEGLAERVSAPPAPGDEYAEDETPMQRVSTDVFADNLAYGAAHVAYCVARYRSYDPSDNSYQPYGGGPRQQCLPN